jgi:hypothetical protein
MHSLQPAQSLAHAAQEAPMKCEANGCTTPSLERKALPGSAADVAAGIPTPWVVTDIPAGWCVRMVENTDVTSSRLVVLCPTHAMGVAELRVTFRKQAPLDYGDVRSLAHFLASVAIRNNVGAYLAVGWLCREFERLGRVMEGLDDTEELMARARAADPDRGQT